MCPTGSTSDLCKQTLIYGKFVRRGGSEKAKEEGRSPTTPCRKVVFHFQFPAFPSTFFPDAVLYRWYENLSFAESAEVIRPNSNIQCAILFNAIHLLISIMRREKKSSGRNLLSRTSASKLANFPCIVWLSMHL